MIVHKGNIVSICHWSIWGNARGPNFVTWSPHKIVLCVEVCTVLYQFLAFGNEMDRDYKFELWVLKILGFLAKAFLASNSSFAREKNK